MKKRRKSSKKQRRPAKARRTDRDKRGSIRAPRDDPPAPPPEHHPKPAKHHNKPTKHHAKPPKQHTKPPEHPAESSKQPPLSPGRLADCHRRARIADQLMLQYPGDNIQQLARRIGISAHTLSLDYKAATGNNLDDVVRENSLQHAARLLTTGTTELNIAQIADACGYAPQSSLTHAIKRRFGQSPRQYRRTMSGDGVTPRRRPSKKKKTG